MQHPMQYYTPTHCIEGQNGTYMPHRGSSYHGGEFALSDSTNIFQVMSIRDTVTQNSSRIIIHLSSNLNIKYYHY